LQVASLVAPAGAADVLVIILVVAVGREDLGQCGNQREVLVLGVVRIRPSGGTVRSVMSRSSRRMARALSTSSTNQ
jgi:hypothetical protein